MSATTIQCPHCGKNTRINLRLDFSLQKCSRCGMRVTAVDTGLEASHETKPENLPPRHQARLGEWSEEREASAAESAAKGPWVWVSLGVLLLAIGGVILWLAKSGPGTAAVPPLVLTDPLSGGEAGEAAESTYEINKLRIEEACRAAETYLAARTVEELLPLIQHRERLEPRVRAFYAGEEGAGLLPLPETTLAPLDRQMWVPRVQSAIVSYDVPNQLPRALALKQEADGRWLVDWPSAVALNEVPWTEFVANKDTAPRLFRVLAARDDYYNLDYNDSTKFLCLKLTDPSMKHLLYGYVEVGTPALETLRQLQLPIRENGVPLLLRLQFREGARGDNQVEITEAISIGWILPEIEQEPLPPRDQ